MSDKVYLNDVIQMMKSKKGAYYLKVTDDGEKFQQFVDNLKPGDAIFLQSQADKIASQVERGVINEERGEELLSKTEFIKFNGTYTFEK